MVKPLNYLSNFVLIGAGICIFFLYSSFSKSYFSNQKSIHSIFNYNQITSVTGKLISSPVKNAKGNFYTAQFLLKQTITKQGKCQAKGVANILIPTQMIEAFFPGKLYSEAFNKGTFLWETGGFYKLNGKFINNSFIVDSCTECIFTNNFKGKIYLIRALCRLQFKRLMYSWGKAGGLLLALLCGSREYTDSNISDCFRKAGLSHILALSGMHLSLFSGIVIFFGNKIGRKKLTFIIRFIALILFVWFAGFSPSLLRAFISSLLVITATIANVKNPDRLIILALSFILQAVLSPTDIYNVGFILSYGALFGILLANRILYRLYSHFIPRFFSISLASSTSAQIITAPVSIKLFGSFSPFGILATVFVSPLITIFIYCGLALILICLVIPDLSGPSGIFMNFLYTIINYLVSFFSKFPIWSIN